MKHQDEYFKLTAEILKAGDKNTQSGFYIFNPETNRGFAVEGFANLLIRKMDGKKTFSEILDETAKEEGVDTSEWSKDIDQFIDDLMTNKLVKVSKEPVEA